MIPVCCWSLKPETKKRFFSMLDRQTRQYGLTSSIVFSGEDESDWPGVMCALEEMEGIGLLVIGLSKVREGLQAQIDALARKTIQKNRYHFILYILEEHVPIEQMLSYCVHPFSILTSPLDSEQMEHVLTNLLTEYQELVQPREDNNYLLVQNSGMHIRLDCREIVCIESLEKKLVIHCGTQVFSVYGSMSEMENRLGSEFLRCHRGYLVNKRKIRSANMPEMMLTLENGDCVPISRSGRTILKGALKRMEEGKL